MKEPLDSRQLRAFTTLAETGSFTLAAQKLFLSPSAVSHSIKALEDEIGCRLLDRLGKRIALTHAGEQLLHHAERILREMNETRAALEQLGNWGQTRLRLGASSTACEHILPGVLRRFKEQFPRCTISIEPGDTPEAIDLLQSGRVDLALALDPWQENSQLEFTPLFSDELAFLLAPSHPWAGSRHVLRKEIPQQHYILYQKTSYTFRLIEEYFRRENMALNTVIELGSMGAIKELVKLGLGVSIIAPWIASQELSDHSLVALPLGPRKLKRTWGILHHRDRRLSLSEESFIRLLKSVTLPSANGNSPVS